MVRSLNGELLASRRKNLNKCSVVCGCGCGGCCCCCCCGVLCCGVLLCVLCVYCVCIVCVLCGFPSKRFAATPAVCPRLFEFLTTLTFGALRKESHCVTDIRGHHKKNNETSSSTCGQQCIMKCQDHRRSKKGTLREKKKIRRP